MAKRKKAKNDNEGKAKAEEEVKETKEGFSDEEKPVERKILEVLTVDDDTEEPEAPEVETHQEEQPHDKTPQTPEGMIRTITLSTDWEEAITTIVVERGMDPAKIDITTLADAFVTYLRRLEGFDFRVPARFILVATILLTMKAEEILMREEERLSKLKEADEIQLSFESPLLVPPAERIPTRPVTLTELVNALNKAMEIKRRKEPLFAKKPARGLPGIFMQQKPPDIEKRIKEIYERIKSKGIVKFSDLVPVWRRKDIVQTFTPLLQLTMRNKIICEQKEMFKEIVIRLK